jgi:trk system potassium uptake protein TrkH
MKRYYPVIRVLSLVILMFGLTMLFPLSLSWFLDDGAFESFDEAFPAYRRYWRRPVVRHPQEKRDLTIRDGFLMVALVWTLLPIYAALPLVLNSSLVLPTPISKPCPD